MKYENISTKQDEKNRIIRVRMTAETWEENKALAKSVKGMDIDFDRPDYVELNINLKSNEDKYEIQ